MDSWSQFDVIKVCFPVDFNSENGNLIFFGFLTGRNPWNCEEIKFYVFFMGTSPQDLRFWFSSIEISNLSKFFTIQSIFVQGRKEMSCFQLQWQLFEQISSLSTEIRTVPSPSLFSRSLSTNVSYWSPLIPYDMSSDEFYEFSVF